MGKIVCVERSTSHLEYRLWNGYEGAFKYIGMPLATFFAFCITIIYIYALFVALSRVWDFLWSTNSSSSVVIDSLIGMVVGTGLCLFLWGLAYLMYAGSVPLRVILDATQKEIQHTSMGTPFVISSILMKNIIQIRFRSHRGEWPPRDWKSGIKISATLHFDSVNHRESFITSKMYGLDFEEAEQVRQEIEAFILKALGVASLAAPPET